MYVLNADVSDSFYRIFLRPTDAPNIGLVFPSEGEDEELVVIPITLPMGCKKLPPIFCTTTETVKYLANEDLRCNTPALPHWLNGMVKSTFR